MQPGQTTNTGGGTMEVVAAALRCQLLLIVLMAAMLLPGMKVSPLLVRRKITRTIELQESICKAVLCCNEDYEKGILENSLRYEAAINMHVICDRVREMCVQTGQFNGKHLFTNASAGWTATFNTNLLDGNIEVLLNWQKQLENDFATCVLTLTEFQNKDHVGVEEEGEEEEDDMEEEEREKAQTQLRVWSTQYGFKEVYVKSDPATTRYRALLSPSTFSHANMGVMIHPGLLKARLSDVHKGLGLPNSDASPTGKGAGEEERNDQKNNLPAWVNKSCNWF
ncbi:hypothetical protein STEG23_021352 [Scotinomys teguina]